MLLLFVKGGSHGWRFDYRFEGKRKMISLGTYPDTSLAAARRKAEKTVQAKAKEAREREEQGLPAVDSFEAVAREWFAVKRGGWATGYADKIIARLEADIFPWLGRSNVAITPPQLLEVLRRIEARGVIETAHRGLENCSQVFRYAIATGKATSNPARDLKDALKRPEPKHFPAITDPKRLGELLRACDNCAATPVVRAALKLAPMLLLRPGVLRFAEWGEMTVPAARMKRELRQKLHGAPHLVPLPRQAVDVLRDLSGLTGNGRFVFRGERHHDRAMSENTINAALMSISSSARSLKACDAQPAESPSLAKSSCPNRRRRGRIPRTRGRNCLRPTINCFYTDALAASNGFARLLP